MRYYIRYPLINNFEEVEEKFEKFLILFELFLKNSIKFHTMERLIFNANTKIKYSKHIIYRFYYENREIVFKNNFVVMKNLIYLFENDVRYFSKLEVNKCTNRKFIENITAKDCQLFTKEDGRKFFNFLLIKQ